MKFDHYETTKRDADKDIEMMMRMKQSQGTPGNGIGGIGANGNTQGSQYFRLGQDALPQSARNLIAS
jgi:hypothetical protein